MNELITLYIPENEFNDFYNLVQNTTLVDDNLRSYLSQVWDQMQLPIEVDRFANRPIVFQFVKQPNSDKFLNWIRLKHNWFSMKNINYNIYIHRMDAYDIMNGGSK